MPKSEKKTGMFSDGKVVENAFRLNIPSDHRMVDIHLSVCITLVIKKKVQKSLNFSASRQPLQHPQHFLPIFNSTVNLSNMLVQHLCKNNMKIDHISQSVDFESEVGVGWGKEGILLSSYILAFSYHCRFQLSVLSCKCG